MNSFNRRAVFFGISAVGVSMLPGLPQAMSDETRQSAENKIRHAARERMLVEDIVKDACLIHLGVRPAHYLEKIAADIEEFDSVVRGLQYGDAERQMQRETSGAVVTALRQANALWLPFRDIARQILAERKVDAETLAALNVADGAILEKLDAVVFALERRYGDKLLPLSAVVATKLTVKEATLVQRIAKQACYITAGVEAEAMRKTMPQLVAEFENTMMALANGFAPLGLEAPTDPAHQAQWHLIAEEWQAFKALVQPVLDGGTLDVEALAALGEQTERSVAAIEAAVTFYRAGV
ncbi:MAG: type IV pili methyl-accepting chemotaxis transducer N-terminal domain-containing protein [Pseudomonadota bacterium]